MELIALVLVIFCSCLIGSMTGIGGGIFIKPILDFLGFFGVSEIAVLSGFALVGMSATNILLNRQRLKEMQLKSMLSLTTGAIMGGMLGSTTLTVLLVATEQDAIVKVIQSSLLMSLLAITLVLMKKQVSLKLTFHPFMLVVIGVTLGFFAAMLSIGGGPINVAILLFIFGFSMKISALYSIFMIFFSQLSGLVTASVTTGFFHYDFTMLALVLAVGAVSGFIGYKVSKFLSNEKTNQFFQYALVAVICLNVVNIMKVL